MCMACASPITTHGAGGDGAIKQQTIMKISLGGRQGGRDLKSSFSFFLSQCLVLFAFSPSASFVVFFSIIAQFFHSLFSVVLVLDGCRHLLLPGRGRNARGQKRCPFQAGHPWRQLHMTRKLYERSPILEHNALVRLLMVIETQHSLWIITDFIYSDKTRGPFMQYSLRLPRSIAA